MALNSGTQGAIAQTKGQPLVAGALAFGVGFLIASAFPGSQTEGQVAQKIREAAQPAVDELKQAGHEAAAALKEPALEGCEPGQRVRIVRCRANPHTAQEAVADSKDAIGTAGQQVADQAKTATTRVQGA